MPVYHLYELVRYTPQELEQRLKTMTFEEREAERLRLHAEYLKSQASLTEPAPVFSTPYNESTE
jgi:hypothetical protein